MPIRQAVAPVKPRPVTVTAVPTPPEVGVKVETTGGFRTVRVAASEIAAPRAFAKTARKRRPESPVVAVKA